ncbi:hypothetical protein F4703DRAFT_1863746 [Phycomyces blakesleeanus]|uniref:Rieske domain-containing protein n=1 Tax=Phycomyces blakesleeanus (strain ATCC 8743b / DSM 1359 / FGSC 10004 / NBRC 33097 / NRRL 1555) TaxID=763407 RepID=A0A167NWE7_PHYB8|nr:hypothetical protein PHYBLDRAFT_185839 [Phycomyces blakesleeanus NRRL 1555(-)]OAD76741.1 hypothetical protein PHYBLDRAFT_185839 [Phycomyces blakesleeanus NRRL 1555(-)]|eukprot:XP_018294781.1 hypothetical protein PHYBLDRAFT_185839 [Phycomyces blakesleeanus NRRL 1555(-)]
MFVPTIKYKRVSEQTKEKENKEVEIKRVELEVPKAVGSTTVPSVFNPPQKPVVVPRPTTVTATPPVGSFVVSIPAIPKSVISAITTEPIKDPEPENVLDSENKESLDEVLVVVEPSIEVDPIDKERIVITLSTGKQYKADRYCPHAGADLSFHGIIGEDDYPPEIGPILTCGIHYWEFVLDRQGVGHNGMVSIEACPVTCKSGSSKLEW